MMPTGRNRGRGRADWRTMKTDSLKSIVDALIFASEMPLSIGRMRQIIREVNQDEIATSTIKEAIEQLNVDNRDAQRGF